MPALSTVTPQYFASILSMLYLLKRVFVLIGYAHPYCPHNLRGDVTPCHASSARVEEEM